MALAATDALSATPMVGHRTVRHCIPSIVRALISACYASAIAIIIVVAIVAVVAVLVVVEILICIV